MMAALAPSATGVPKMPSWINPFALPGRWYRGNIHTHTDVSDGRLTIQQRCDAYRSQGYDFIVITDHNKVVDPSDCSREDFLAIPGAEFDLPPAGDEKPCHVVAINVREQIDVHQMQINQVIAAIREQGGLAVIAHPYWSGMAFTDFEQLDGYVGIEVYNDTARRGIGKGDSEPHWDDHLDRIGPTLGFATDDAHTEADDVFAGWIMVKADRLTIDPLLSAIREGAFYSTQGPTFADIRVEPSEAGAQIAVQSSPVQSIVFKGRCSTGRHVRAPAGEQIERAEYRCTGSEKYIRVVLIDRAGRRAWSNPLWLDELT